MRLPMKYVMQNDGDFEDVILLYLLISLLNIPPNISLPLIPL